MIDGGLFTRDFLLEGICEQDAWKALDQNTIDRIRGEALQLFGNLLKIHHPSEPVTEKDLIWPVLAAIGWGSLIHVQPNLSAKGREDVPDALLFADAAAHDRARRESDDWKRFQHGACIVEAKRWSRVLDREDGPARGDEGVPSTQMLRYLRRVDDVTQGRLRWGILTNGRKWRLYWQGALSVAEDFLEIDLGQALDLPGCEPDLVDHAAERYRDRPAHRDHAFKLFVALFGRWAFLPSEQRKTFHDIAIAEGKFWEERVARDLSNVVFDSVFPGLADALAKHDPQRDPRLGSAYLDDLRQGSLILLYRLLFVLYAEDRNLLPDESGAYADYCLTRIRVEIAERKASAGSFPSVSQRFGQSSPRSFEPSRRETTRSAFRPTMGDCLRRRPRRSWIASSCRTQLWPMSFLLCRMLRTARAAADRSTSITATSRCNSLAQYMSAYWSTGCVRPRRGE